MDENNDDQLLLLPPEDSDDDNEAVHMHDEDDQREVNIVDAGDRMEEAADNRHIQPDKIRKSIKSNNSSTCQQVIINFDQSLPSAHSYLGNDLEDVRGRTIFEESSIMTMPLLLLPSVVLVPGQVIPLQLYTHRLVAMVRRVADKDKTFGVINLSKNYDDEGRHHFTSIGCTAEIFSMKDEMDEPSGISTVRVKARGRQRFKIVDMKSEITGDIIGRIRILPEVSMVHVLEGARLPSHRKLMVQPPDDSDDMIKTAVDRQGNILTSVDLRFKNPITKMYTANYMWWPPWVYQMYDIDWLVEQIKAELHSWCPSLPPDPVDLSFWVAHNLPVNDEMRLRLLAFDSVVQRLRFGLSIIRKSGVILCCDSCQEEIANKKHVFSMSREGPLGAYVNPGGHVHEMFTVLSVKNLENVGFASTEHSWFPGYAWTIVQCRGCNSHMGWMFTVAKMNLSPKKFWGLCRSSIKTSFGKVEEQDEKEKIGFIV